MRIIKHFFGLVLSMAVCLSLICTSVSAACDMKDYSTDTASGWSLFSGKSHRGGVVSDYKYVNSEIKNRYSSDMNAAIKMWGSHIIMGETNSSGYGTISVKNDSSDGAIATTFINGPTNGHINDNFTIEINQAKFDNLSSTVKKIALAHEIGHVYGLDHFNNTKKIMNPTALSTMSISSDEFAGIDACTHRHSHTNFSYVRRNASYHIARCTYCKVYKYQAHYYSSSSNVCIKCGYPKSSAIGIDDYEDYDEQNNDDIEIDNVSQDKFEYENEMTNLYDTPFVNNDN